MSFAFETIGVVHSCYKSKFGIPRQPGLISEAKGSIELLPPYNQPNAIRGLDGFSHIWVLWVFSENLREGWKATVRPPRLGGDKRIGVFASRSPFRPNPIGLSAMKLEGVEEKPHGILRLLVSGLDLVEGTPVIDIKPYLHYTDAITGAVSGFAPAAPEAEPLLVSVAPTAAASFERLPAEFQRLCLKVIAADPRPAYQRISGRSYQCYLEDREIVWEVGEDPATAFITAVNRVKKR